MRFGEKAERIRTLKDASPHNYELKVILLVQLEYGAPFQMCTKSLVIKIWRGLEEIEQFHGLIPTIFSRQLSPNNPQNRKSVLDIEYLHWLLALWSTIRDRANIAFKFLPVFVSVKCTIDISFSKFRVSSNRKFLEPWKNYNRKSLWFHKLFCLQISIRPFRLLKSLIRY